MKSYKQKKGTKRTAEQPQSSDQNEKKPKLHNNNVVTTESKKQPSMSDDSAPYINKKYLNPTEAELAQIISEYKKGTPFNWIMMKNFLNEKFCEEVRKEVETLEWYPKRNDLYTFFQTDDLKNCDEVCFLFHSRWRTRAIHRLNETGSGLYCENDRRTFANYARHSTAENFVLFWKE
jgi:hypothetical protein